MKMLFTDECIVYAVDIDDCIEQALKIKEIILNQSYEGAFPLKKWYLEDNFDNRQ
jgi:hypothetical protein